MCMCVCVLLVIKDIKGIPHAEENITGGILENLMASYIMCINFKIQKINLYLRS